MIGQICGVLVAKKPPMISLRVSGITYDLDVSMNTFDKLPPTGEEINLYTHMLVREDSHSLIGFFSDTERDMFRILIKINGIGARIALSVLSAINVPQLKSVISSGDIKNLTKVPGIGSKTAQRMVLEMKDKLKTLCLDPEDNRLAISVQNDAVEALLALGYGQREIDNVMNKVDQQQPLSKIIKEALGVINNNHK